MAVMHPLPTSLRNPSKAATLIKKSLQSPDPSLVGNVNKVGSFPFRLGCVVPRPQLGAKRNKQTRIRIIVARLVLWEKLFSTLDIPIRIYPGVSYE